MLLHSFQKRKGVITMRSIEVCVGSSCHLRGSYEVIGELKRLLAEYALEAEFELKGCFCLGECKNGVSLRVDGKVYTLLNKDNVRKFVDDHLLAKVTTGGTSDGID
jgi:NADH:ubiquinone oxidoreductase subunit E